MMHKFVMGSARVGARGQVVLPVNVRKSCGIEPGDTLIVMVRPGPGGQAISLMKATLLARALEHIEETGRRIRSLVGSADGGRPRTRRRVATAKRRRGK